MTRGRSVEEGVKLVPYNTKIKAETKEVLDALVTVLKLSGQRELLEKMLQMYERQYPDNVAKAQELIILLGNTGTVAAPTDKRGG